ncbi:MAG: hypothetical protein R2880_04625 [Deinococcales bacterium]
MPVYVVEGVGVSAADATKLAEALDIQADIREASGKLFYVDALRFQALPMTDLGQVQADEEGGMLRAEGFNFAAINAMPEYDESLAQTRVETALKGLNLIPTKSETSLKHSLFEAVNLNHETIAAKALDTQVIIQELAPDGKPLVGQAQISRWSLMVRVW